MNADLEQPCARLDDRKFRLICLQEQDSKAYLPSCWAVRLIFVHQY
jgi:hypothetical protein